MPSTRFATIVGESASAMTLSFARAPSFPMSYPSAQPLWICYRAADGSPFIEETGKAADVELAWPPESPMTADDFDSLCTFWRYVRGTQDQFNWRDEENVTRAAHFTTTLEGWRQVPNGYTGSVMLRTRSTS